MMRFATLALLLVMLGCSPGYFNQGVKATNNGDYARATDLYYEEIRANPESHAAWRELGVNFYEAGGGRKGWQYDEE